MAIKSPSMFGLNNSNRDFSNAESWGKNQFNSSFPASLLCYMGTNELAPVYITLNKKLNIIHEKIPAKDIFGLEPLSKDLYFGFESNFTPYTPLVIGNLPRIDLVTIDTSRGSNTCLRGLEIKLTALPDHQTCDLKEDQYGCEIVVRPDTIVYLALSVADAFKSKRKELKKYFDPIINTKLNWENMQDVESLLPGMCDQIDSFVKDNIELQKPFMIQPIWKTEGKYLRLKKDCFDAFVWSDFAFTRLFIDSTKSHTNANNITRHMRTTAWLTKMLSEFAVSGKIKFQWIIDHMTYNTKNDKAFASGGLITYPYMKSQELTKPRVDKYAIKKIILGGGEKFLSPERRLDAAILSSRDLF